MQPSNLAQLDRLLDIRDPSIFNSERILNALVYSPSLNSGTFPKLDPWKSAIQIVSVCDFRIAWFIIKTN